MNIDVIASVVICGLFFMLGLFVSTVIAEKRNFKLKENQMKEKISAAGGAGRSKEDAAEFDRLHAEIARHVEDLKAKDREIEKLFDQVSRTAEEHRKIQEKLAAASSGPQRSQEDMAELERLRAEVTGQQEAIQTKDREIGKLIEQVNRATQEHHKVQEQLLASAGGQQRSQEDAAELERLRAEVASQLESMKLKDAEIAKLIEKVDRGTEEERKLQSQLSESSGDKGEVGRLRTELSAKIEEVNAKDRELAKLREERKDIEGRLAQAGKNMAEYGRFEDAVREQKKSFYDTEQRIREIKIKLRVLSEKAKENAELVAAFAEGKEFDEFRKSIHLDELTQKYEEQIKDLKTTDKNEPF